MSVIVFTIQRSLMCVRDDNSLLCDNVVYKVLGCIPKQKRRRLLDLDLQRI